MGARRLQRDTSHNRDGDRLTDLDVDLIVRTYLETDDDGRKRTLAAVAKELGITESAATARRLRAVRRIARLLDRPDLARSGNRHASAGDKQGGHADDESQRPHSPRGLAWSEGSRGTQSGCQAGKDETDPIGRTTPRGSSGRDAAEGW
jgi:hypothetical protein